MPRYPQQKTARPVDPILTAKVVALANDPQHYLQDVLLPTLFDGSNVPEGTESYWSGTIQRTNEGAFFGDPDKSTLVARGVTIPTYEGVGYDPMEYEAQKYAVLVEIPKEDMHIVQAGSTPNTDVQLAGATELMKIDRELRYEELFMTAANWRNSSTLGAAAKWDVQATSDPNDDLSDAVYAVSGYGRRPNVCILGRQAAHLLRKNAAFLEFDDVNTDRTIYNDERLKDVIKARYGIQHVFIGEVTHKTSGDLQSANLTPVNVWDDDVWIGYLPMNGETPATGPTVGQVDAGGDLFPMQQMAAGRVIVEGWSVERDDSAGFKEHVETHKELYIESIFTVQEPLGYVIAAVAT